MRADVNLAPLLTGKKRRRVAKRVVDIVVSLAVLILSIPVAALVILAIRIDSPGPIFFSQFRLGQHGRLIRIHKFRKFSHCPTLSDLSLTLSDDCRLTSVGRVLRRSKLDEAPQFWNILVGDMSLVGPRPETLDFYDCFIGPYGALLQFKPGIFGPSQVFFRNECSLYPPEADLCDFYRQVLFPIKARVDLTYYPYSTGFQDLLWIIRSVIAIFLHQWMCDKDGDWIERVEAWIDQRGPHSGRRGPEARHPCAPR